MFGFIPNNIELYKLALVHKSASIDIGGRSINNERLEFLGDAVIESITSDYLFIEYPDYDEGQLTKLRSKLVSRQSLNAIACKLGLDKHIICCRSVNATQKHIFGDAFEAMMGAIYLDQGYNFANRLLINDIYASKLSLEEVDETETDFKSRLIEWGQKNHHTVLFRTKGNPTGAGATRSFHCTVLVDNLEVGHGLGSSKKEAEQRAAESATHEPSDEEIARMLDKLDKMSK
ncbi:MAG: ribonuclease III [Alistipes sp.]|nr:ribonuclease III [Alistipes sp.]